VAVKENGRLVFSHTLHATGGVEAFVCACILLIVASLRAKASHKTFLYYLNGITTTGKTSKG